MRWRVVRGYHHLLWHFYAFMKLFTLTWRTRLGQLHDIGGYTWWATAFRMPILGTTVGAELLASWWTAAFWLLLTGGGKVSWTMGYKWTTAFSLPVLWCLSFCTPHFGSKLLDPTSVPLFLSQASHQARRVFWLWHCDLGESFILFSLLDFFNQGWRQCLWFFC